MDEGDDSPKIKELKSSVFHLEEIGTAQYEKHTKAIGEYAGCMYGPEMKKLIMKGVEAVISKLTYPTNDSEEEKAIWSKMYDVYLKEKNEYKKNKSKVFTIIVGQCDKSMKNRVESDTHYEQAELDDDVVVLLTIIKDICFDSNEKKYPPMQAVSAWKSLVLAWQGDEEELIDYYKCIIGLVELVERCYGKVAPEKIAENNTSTTVHVERNRMLAYKFIEGTNRKKFGSLMKDLNDDYALGHNKYPVNVEDALQALTLQSVSASRKKGNSTNGVPPGLELSYLQSVLSSAGNV